MACVFCSIAQRKEGLGTRILWEDDQVVVFSPRTKDSRTHLLCVPKRHVEQTVICSKDGLKVERELLLHMREVGQRAVRASTDPKEIALDIGEEEAPLTSSQELFVFHRPPFNSIAHLHLHCMSGEFSSWYSRLRFSLAINSWLPQRMRWCVATDDLLSRL